MKLLLLIFALLGIAFTTSNKSAEEMDREQNDDIIVPSSILEDCDRKCAGELRQQDQRLSSYLVLADLLKGDLSQECKDFEEQAEIDFEVMDSEFLRLKTLKLLVSCWEGLEKQKNKGGQVSEYFGCNMECFYNQIEEDNEENMILV